jgi:hypothetical protein
MTSRGAGGTWATYTLGRKGVAIWRDTARDSLARGAIEALAAVGLDDLAVLSTHDIREGRLDIDSCALLYAPSGFSAFERVAALGNEGIAALERFVEAGGGFVGDGDGARLALEIGLLSDVLVRPSMRSNCQSDDCVVTFTDLGIRLTSSAAGASAREMVTQLRGGPRIVITDSEAMKGVVCTFASDFVAGEWSVAPLAFSDVTSERFIGALASPSPERLPLTARWERKKAKPRMRGTPAIVVGHRGRGRVVISSPSPTSAEPAMTARFRNLMLWAAFLPPAEMPGRALSPAAYRVECHVTRTRWLRTRVPRYTSRQRARDRDGALAALLEKETAFVRDLVASGDDATALRAEDVARWRSPRVLEATPSEISAAAGRYYDGVAEAGAESWFAGGMRCGRKLLEQRWPAPTLAERASRRGDDEHAGLRRSPTRLPSAAVDQMLTQFEATFSEPASTGQAGTAAGSVGGSPNLAEKLARGAALIGTLAGAEAYASTRDDAQRRARAVASAGLVQTR